MTASHTTSKDSTYDEWVLTLPVVTVGWLTLFINGYADQPQAVAGPDAIAPGRADQEEPTVAAQVSVAAKTALADQLWAVFDAKTAGERTNGLNALLARYRLEPVLGLEAQLRWRTAANQPDEVLAAACLAALLDAVGSYGWHRLGTCDAFDCVDVYIDQAGRSPRRYCTATCLNRAKVRAYRARQSTGH